MMKLKQLLNVIEDPNTIIEVWYWGAIEPWISGITAFKALQCCEREELYSTIGYIDIVTDSDNSKRLKVTLFPR